MEERVSGCMVKLIATLKVKEGKMDEVIALLKDLVPKIRTSEPDTEVYIPHTVKGRKNKNTIIILEKYPNAEARNAHSARLPETMGPIFPLLEPGLDVLELQEII